MTGKARVVGAIVLTFTAAAALSSCNIITPAAFILMAAGFPDALANPKAANARPRSSKCCVVRAPACWATASVRGVHREPGARKK